jgi:hypothetical protein
LHWNFTGIFLTSSQIRKKYVWPHPWPRGHVIGVKGQKSQNFKLLQLCSNYTGIFLAPSLIRKKYVWPHRWPRGHVIGVKGQNFKFLQLCWNCTGMYLAPSLIRNKYVWPHRWPRGHVIWVKGQNLKIAPIVLKLHRNIPNTIPNTEKICLTPSVTQGSCDSA